MYAHVTTYRLSDSREAAAALEAYARTGEPVDDQTARTIASWYHSPSAADANLTALSHGRPFDTDGLRAELEAGRVTPGPDNDALTAWVLVLEDALAE